MIYDERAPISQSEVPKEVFFSRLPSDTDRQNLNNLLTWIVDATQFTESLGTILGVGGTLKKQPPRKDIDLLWVPVKREAKTRQTPYRQAMEGFKVMQKIVTRIESEHPEIKIVRQTEPLIDEEFNTESILRHDGSIELQFPNGVPIEIIRSHIEGMEDIREFRSERKEPYSVLT